MSNLEKLKKLYEEGQELLKTRWSSRGGVVAPDKVNHAKFVKWKYKTLNFLQKISIDGFRFNTFKNELNHRTSRMDFLIKDINTVIETKMTRETLKDKKNW